MLETFFWFTTILKGSDKIFYELSWIFINLTSLVDPDFMKEIAWPELFTFINRLLEFEKTTIIDNILHVAINLIGSSELIWVVLNNTRVLDFFKSWFDNANIKVKIARKGAWFISNLAKQKQTLFQNE